MKFVEYRNEGAGDFVAWCEANPAACLRRYQVRDTGVDAPAAVVNGDTEERLVTFEILVAYPQSQRFGGEGALDRDDAIRSDQLQLEAAIGMAAGGNFIVPYPDACWRSSVVTRRAGTSCDFLVIMQTMSYVMKLGPAPAAVDVVTNLPTTVKALRDHARELVRAIAPLLLASDRFLEIQADADFRTWCLENPTSALRRFQIRDTGAHDPPSMANTELEARLVVLEVLAAYPQNSRYGARGALDRDDTMKTDQVALERVLGVQGYAHWTGPDNPNATIVGTAIARELGAGVDFLVITITLAYRCAR